MRQKIDDFIKSAKKNIKLLLIQVKLAMFV